MAQISIIGQPPEDPRQRVIAVAAAVEALCFAVGADPSEGITTALCAAAKIAMAHTDKRGDDLVVLLASALGSSIVAAGHWFDGGSGEKPIN